MGAEFLQEKEAQDPQHTLTTHKVEEKENKWKKWKKNGKNEIEGVYIAPCTELTRWWWCCGGVVVMMVVVQ